MPSPAPSIPSLAPDPGTHRHAARQHSPLPAAYTITGCRATRPPGGTSALARQGDLMPPSMEGPPVPRFGGRAVQARGMLPCGHWRSALLGFRAPPLASPRSQCLRLLPRDPAAQRISAFSTGLTGWLWPLRVGGCANGLRIACGAGPLGGRCHHSLVTPIDWKLWKTKDTGLSPVVGHGHHSLVTPIDWKLPAAGLHHHPNCWRVTTRW